MSIKIAFPHSIKNIPRAKTAVKNKKKKEITDKRRQNETALRRRGKSQAGTESAFYPQKKLAEIHYFFGFRVPAAASDVLAVFVFGSASPV